MSQYSRRQEDRAEEKLKAIGFRLVEDTGRRYTGHGDKVMKHDDTGVGLTIDNKSTHGQYQTKIDRRWIQKIRKEAAPGTTPAITLTFYNHEKVYILFDIDDLEGVMY